MSKTISSFSLIILVLSSSLCFAQSGPVAPQSRLILDNVAKILIESQNQLTAYSQKNKSQIDTKLRYLSTYKTDVNNDTINKKKVLTEVDGKLQQKLLDLYSVQAQLDIYPNIVEFSNKLVSMSDYYREQAGIVNSSETLSSGSVGQHFQKRRNALSLMIAQMNQEILDLRSFVNQNKAQIQKHSQDLNDAINNRYTKHTILGFDHFLNLKIALLSNQEEILHDISRLDSGRDLDNNSGNLANLCEETANGFGNLKVQNNLLVDSTRTWVTELLKKPDYSVNKWRNERSSQSPYARNLPKDIDDYFGGFRDTTSITWPGLISGWKSCRGTKYNIFVVT
jgi:hypothetical protein